MDTHLNSSRVNHAPTWMGRIITPSNTAISGSRATRYSRAASWSVSHGDEPVASIFVTGSRRSRQMSPAVISVPTSLCREPGQRQKEIRARVAPFPNLDKDRHGNVDVSTIPCRAAKR
jgi:hypothetical protein